MRRTYLRGRENILKRQLIHVSAFNLGLIFRGMLGAGTPRELNNRQSGLVFVFFCGYKSAGNSRRDRSAGLFRRQSGINPWGREPGPGIRTAPGSQWSAP
jgi:hypothetical protein